jgi:hypothetical protein
VPLPIDSVTQQGQQRSLVFHKEIFERLGEKYTALFYAEDRSKMVFIECVSASDDSSQTLSIERGHFCWGMEPTEIVTRLRVNEGKLELDTKSPDIKLYKLLSESEPAFELMELMHNEGVILGPSHGEVVTSFHFVIAGVRYKVKVVLEQDNLVVEHYVLEPVEKFVAAEIVDMDLLTDSSGCDATTMSITGDRMDQRRVRIEYLVSRSLRVSNGALKIDRGMLRQYKEDEKTHVSSKF